MSLDKHRKPDGTWNGVGVMSELTGLPQDEIRSIAEQVKANHAKLRTCQWHEFEGFSDSAAAAPTPLHLMRYRCRHCQGEVDHSAYHWHQQGRRPMPVGEPQPAAYSFTPVPGARCSRDLADAGMSYPKTCQVHGLRCGVKS